MTPSRFAVLDLDDEYCRGCGEPLGALDSLYCGKSTCQETKRSGARDAPGAFPKEKLLAMLEMDLESSELQPFTADVMFLIAEVQRHPWNDCSAFLVKRTALLDRCKSNQKNVPVDLGFLKTFPEKTFWPFTAKPYGPTPYDGQTEPRYGQSKRRDEVIGFGPMNVSACSVSIFQSMSQCPVQLDRLIISRNIGQYFDICDIRIGNTSMACSNPIPALAFSELAIGINLGLPELMVGMFLSLAVMNKTNENQLFAATFIGRVKEF